MATLTPPIVTTTRNEYNYFEFVWRSYARTPANDVLNQTLTTPVIVKHHPATNPKLQINVSVSYKILSSVYTTVLPISIGGKTSEYTSAGSDPVNTIVTQASSSLRQSPAMGQRAERDQNRDL